MYNNLSFFHLNSNDPKKPMVNRKFDWARCFSGAFPCFRYPCLFSLVGILRFAYRCKSSQSPFLYTMFDIFGRFDLIFMEEILPEIHTFIFSREYVPLFRITETTVIYILLVFLQITWTHNVTRSSEQTNSHMSQWHTVATFTLTQKFLYFRILRDSNGFFPDYIIK